MSGQLHFQTTFCSCFLLNIVHKSIQEEDVSPLLKIVYYLPQSTKYVSRQPDELQILACFHYQGVVTGYSFRIETICLKMLQCPFLPRKRNISSLEDILDKVTVSKMKKTKKEHSEYFWQQQDMGTEEKNQWRKSVVRIQMAMESVCPEQLVKGPSGPPSAFPQWPISYLQKAHQQTVAPLWSWYWLACYS